MTKNASPIFQDIFGENWQKLPKVFLKHYANKPYSDDEVIMHGKMSVKFSFVFKLIKLLLQFLQILVPYQVTNIPVTVVMKSSLDSKAVNFNRQFFLSDNNSYFFRSKMIQIKDNEVIELMRFGIGWCFSVHFSGNKIFLMHKKYIWKIFNLMIPLPINWLVGVGYAEEEALSDDSFRMQMLIKHPIWGITYNYHGVFNIVGGHYE